MSAAIVVRRLDPNSLLKKRAADMERAKARALAKKFERDGKPIQKFAPMADVIEIKATTEQIERNRVAEVRGKIDAMIEFERTRKPSDRQPMFEAYLELCSKTGLMPDAHTCTSFERFTAEPAPVPE